MSLYQVEGVRRGGRARATLRATITRTCLIATACLLMGTGLILLNAADAGATTADGTCAITISGTASTNPTPGGTLSSTSTPNQEPTGFAMGCDNFDYGVTQGFQVTVYTGTQEYQWGEELWNNSTGALTITATSFIADFPPNTVPNYTTSSPPYTFWEGTPLTCGSVTCYQMMDGLGVANSVTTQQCRITMIGGTDAGDTIACQLGLFGSTYTTGPCNLISAYGPNKNGQNSFGYADNLWVFTYTGSASTIVTQANVNPAYTSSTPPDYYASETVVGTGHPSSPMSYVYITPIGSGDGTATQDVNETTTTTGDLPTTLDTWCLNTTSDGTTTWYYWGDILQLANNSCSLSGTGCTVPTTPVDQGSSCEAQAVSNSGIGVNPSSWVPGLVLMIGGELKCLFIPQQSSVTAIENDFGIGTSPACNTGGAATVTQWFGCMTSGLLVAPAADVGTLKGYADSDSCTSITGGGTDLTIAGTSINACALVADTNNSHFSSPASTLISAFVNIMAAAVYLLCALAFLHFIMGVISSSKK